MPVGPVTNPVLWGNPNLVDAIRDAVWAAGLSYAELARRSGVSQPQLSRFMSGERDLTLAVADKLFQALGLLVVAAGAAAAPVAEKPAQKTSGRAKRPGKGK